MLVIRAGAATFSGYLSAVLCTDSFISYAMRSAKGVKMPRGDITAIRAFPVFLPPLAEQKKIADCLSSLDELIAAEAQKLDALKSHKKALMQQLFPRESEAVPRLRFPEFQGPGGLNKTTLGRISLRIAAGGTPSTSERSYWGGEHRWMCSGELNHKRVYDVQGRITEEGLRSSSASVVPARCVLIGLAGQGKTRGTVAMNMVPLCTNQSIAAIFPNGAIFDSDFIYHNLDSRYDELRSLSAGGGGRGGLNLEIIKNLGIILPSLPEQKKIADCLSSLDDLVRAQSQILETLKAHKKALMQQLFPSPDEVPA